MLQLKLQPRKARCHFVESSVYFRNGPDLHKAGRSSRNMVLIFINITQFVPNFTLSPYSLAGELNIVSVPCYFNRFPPFFNRYKLELVSVNVLFSALK